MIDLVLLSAVTPALTGVIGALMTGAVLAGLAWVWQALKKQLNEGHKQNTETLAQILTQTQKTNGRVDRLEKENGFLRERTAGLESAIFRRPPITGADEMQ